MDRPDFALNCDGVAFFGLLSRWPPNKRRRTDLVETARRLNHRRLESRSCGLLLQQTSRLICSAGRQLALASCRHRLPTLLVAETNTKEAGVPASEHGTVCQLRFVTSRSYDYAVCRIVGMRYDLSDISSARGPSVDRRPISSGYPHPSSPAQRGQSRTLPLSQPRSTQGLFPVLHRCRQRR